MKLAGVVFEKVVLPSLVGLLAAIFCQCGPDFLVRAHTGAFESLRVVECTQDKSPLGQALRYPLVRVGGPVSVTVEVDQGDHMSIWPAIQVRGVVRLETIQNFDPAICLRKNLNPSSNGPVQFQGKANRKLTIGAVLRQHQDVRLRSVDQSGLQITANERTDKIAPPLELCEWAHARGLKVVSPVKKKRVLVGEGSYCLRIVRSCDELTT